MNRAPFAGTCSYQISPPVTMNDVANDGETEPGAAVRSGAGVVGAPEPFEDPITGIDGYAWAVVRDTESGRLVVLGQRD